MSSAAPKELFVAFQSRYGHSPTVHSFAPGRLNFIGEHIDYLGGHVVPAAINFGCHVLLSFQEMADSDANNDSDWQFTFSSLEVDSDKPPVSFSVNPSEHTSVIESPTSKGKSLGIIARGAVLEAFAVAKIEASTALPSSALPMKVHGLISSTIPIGAGLSSSAALCVSLIQGCLRGMIPATVFESIESAVSADVPHRDQPLHKFKNAVARAAQRVENLHCGMNCGIMDQYASVHGKANTILEVDCAAMAHRSVPLFSAEAGGYQLLLVNSMRAHDLGSNYNEVRADLESAEKKINLYLQQTMDQVLPVSYTEMAGASFGGISSLDIIDSLLEKEQPEGASQLLDSLSTREHGRARYAVSEMERVATFVALAASSTQNSGANAHEILTRLGTLLNATHSGLANQLLVSTVELDRIVAICGELGQDRVFGARLMGGGFGGCALVLANASHGDEVQQTLQAKFAETFPELGPCVVYRVGLCDGAMCETV